MTVDFIRERITQLRLKAGVSEYKMSYALGHNKGYINNICSGKALPSLPELFAICDYFGITPKEFFDEKADNPKLAQELLLELDGLEREDMELLKSLAARLREKG